MRTIIIVIFSFLFSYNIMVSEGILKDIKPDKDQKYIIQLVNGDILSGYIVESVNSPTNGEGIKFSTEIGTATIYESQIRIIKPEIIFYKHNHRIFLLPTAEPIGDNHFLGNFELLLFYGGFGISNWISITAGRTVVPKVYPGQQASVINAKVTLMEMPLEFPANQLSFALGANIGWVNDANRLIHYYGVGTLSLNRSSISAAIFYKAGSKDYYQVYMGNNAVVLNYLDGSYGLGIGLDTRFSTLHDLHFIGELWNSDITQPTNSAVMLGLRLCSPKFSADFGLSFFTEPFVAPFCSFVWTPFN